MAVSLQLLTPSLHVSSVSIHVFSSVYLCPLSPLFSLVRTIVTAFRVHPDNPGRSLLQILNLIPSSKTLFSHKFPFVGSSGQDLDTIFLRATIQSTADAFGDIDEME